MKSPVGPGHPNWDQHPSNPEHQHRWKNFTLTHSKKTFRVCACGKSQKTGGDVDGI